MSNLILIFLGGGLGSLLRYALGTWLSPMIRYPYHTFIINAMGSLLIGITMGYILQSQSAQHQLRFFVVVGFCGGFTTFSTFSYEVLTMLQRHQWSMALLYVILSVIICTVLTALGMWCMK